MSRRRHDCSLACAAGWVDVARQGWQRAAAAATAALRAWLHAPQRERARAYFEYRVALEVEEREAIALEVATGWERL